MEEIARRAAVIASGRLQKAMAAAFKAGIFTQGEVSRLKLINKALGKPRDDDAFARTLRHADEEADRLDHRLFQVDSKRGDCEPPAPSMLATRTAAPPRAYDAPVSPEAETFARDIYNPDRSPPTESAADEVARKALSPAWHSGRCRSVSIRRFRRR